VSWPPPEQVVPEGSALSRPVMAATETLRHADPTLHRAAEDVLGALRQDMLPAETQEALFHALNPAVQRNLIAEVSGLDAGVLASFKQQLTLIDAILRRTFNSDGTLAPIAEEGMSMNPKDVLNMSLKVTQLMVRELPKVYSMDRVQKMEQALLKVMSEKLTRDQQEAFLEELDKHREKV
jgi:hypothetical protein